MEVNSDRNLNLVLPRAKARAATIVKTMAIWLKTAQKSVQAAQAIHRRGRATAARHQTLGAAPRDSTARLGGIRIQLITL
jgi:hypothetical protein